MDVTPYLRQISERGDQYGGNGGLLDLLMWCNKLNTASVTVEEAKAFLAYPELSYEEAMGKSSE